MIAAQVIQAYEPEQPWWEIHLPGTYVTLNEIIIGDVFITPEMAKYVIDKHNPRNRPVRRPQMARLIKTFQQRQMQFNGDTVVFDDHAAISNGQHRLIACIETGIGFRTLVVIGVQGKCFKTFDQVARRSVSDALSMEGQKNVATLASGLSIVRMFYLTGRFQRSLNSKMTIHDHLETFEKIPDFANSACVNYKGGTRLLQGAGLTSALHYVFSKANPELAEQFFASIASQSVPANQNGETIRRWHGVRLLLDRLGESITNSRKAKLPMVAVSALTVKAWNALYLDTLAKHLRWMPDEPYPKVAGWIYRDAIPSMPVPAGRPA